MHPEFKSWLLLAVLLLAVLLAPNQAFSAPKGTRYDEKQIINRPIVFDKKRIALSIAYRQRHQDPKINSVHISPQMIVLHSAGFSTAEKAWRYFSRPTIEVGRQKIRQAGLLNVSAHFLVGRNGQIYRLMPETWMARHCIGLNHIALGIENLGRAPHTTAQVAANSWLVRYLVQKHPIRYLIGHYEYRQFENHALFKEREKKYRTVKRDPGGQFMRLVRANLSDLKLLYRVPKKALEKTPEAKSKPNH